MNIESEAVSAVTSKGLELESWEPFAPGRQVERC